ncbi:MAG: AraC family transcriptional regulator [Steroidobacteraceae bacterium]
MTANIESCQFSSEALRPADRISFYRDVACRMLGTVDIEPAGESFSCSGRFFQLPDLGISRITSSAMLGNRTREMVAGDELLLIASLDGAATVSHVGRQATIPARGAVLVSSAEPCCVAWTESCRMNVRLPRAALAPMIVNPDAALMSVIPGTIEPLRLLTSYIDLLLHDSMHMERAAELRGLVVRHVHDLVALTVGATRDAAEIAAGRGLRAARMGAITADIARNLAGDITVAALSARHHLTPRYIRKLFEGENTSLSRFVLLQRLARVHRMLTDPRHAGRTIGDIALAVGFGDISTFNREFRRQFGMTPSDVRAAARNGMM